MEQRSTEKIFFSMVPTKVLIFSYSYEMRVVNKGLNQGTGFPWNTASYGDVAIAHAFR
jgi:hypothetical protein